ncbi:glycoside hydrolase family 3 N-terminal domain-containing protein [Streptomyces sp. NPDC046985]|uniref:glycoside hydrolase family 3 N-terminal domain-containing protein n=1 Tax=Streptomyces sp. NPDC046985 TaxID=3155377 RepID=UPI0034041B1E
MTSQQARSHAARTKRAHWSAPVLALALAAASLQGASAAHAVHAVHGAPAAGASAPGTPHTATTCAERVYRAMSDPQRVGQLFMGAVNASTPDQRRIQILRDYHVGSVFLAGRSTAGVNRTKSLVDGLQAKADSVSGRRVGLLVSTDQEGGQVQVLSGPGFSAMPSAVQQGAWSPAELRGQAAKWAGQLKSAGLNLNLAPVADVVPASLGRANGPIGRYDREYGHTAAAVAPHSDAFAAGFAQARVLATLKHFPGLGAVRGNTDTTAGVVDSVTTTRSSSLGPFSSGIKAGAPFVMISLATYTKIDARRQAVFSPTVIQQLLRKSMGFKGVVISDDLGKAVAVKAVPPGDRAVNFLAAGGDLALTVEPDLIPAMTKAVETRMAQSPAFRSQVEQSVRRVLAAKRQAGLITCG